MGMSHNPSAMNQHWFAFQGATEVKLTGASTCGSVDFVVRSMKKMMPAVFRTSEGGQGLRILDVGAGVGGASVEFLRQLPRAEVLSFTTNDINWGAFMEWSLLAERGVPYFSHTLRPSLEFPLASESFDVIYCCECPLFPSLVETVLREFNRVLRLGGVAFIAGRALQRHPNFFEQPWFPRELSLIHFSIREFRVTQRVNKTRCFSKTAEACGAPIPRLAGDRTDELLTLCRRIVGAAALPWELGFHTRVLDVNAAATGGRFAEALRELQDSRSGAQTGLRATRVSHVAWGAKPQVLQEVAARGFVGFAAACGRLPLRDGSLDVVAALRFDSLVQHSCPGKLASSSVLQEVDRVLRDDGLVLLELPAAWSQDLPLPIGWRLDFSLLALFRSLDGWKAHSGLLVLPKAFVKNSHLAAVGQWTEQETHSAACLKVMDWMCMVFWTLNIFAMLTEGDFACVMTPASILVHYLRTWAIVDLILVVPDWIYTVAIQSDAGSSSNVLRIARLFRTLRFLRLLKLKWIIDAINDLLDSEVTAIFVNVVKMVLLLLAINHLIACIWYSIALLSGEAGQPNWLHHHGFDRATWSYKYLVAFHWSLTRFAPASMQVQPQNEWERTFAIFIVVFALVGFSCFVGSITASLLQLRSMSAEADGKIWQLRHFLRRSAVPIALSLRIQRFVQHADKKQGQQMPIQKVEVLSLLSGQLARELNCALNLPHMSLHPLFKFLNEVSSITMQWIAATAVERMIMARGDMLFLPGEKAPSNKQQHNVARILAARILAALPEGQLLQCCTDLGCSCCTSFFAIKLLVLQTTTTKKQQQQQRNNNKETTTTTIQHFNILGPEPATSAQKQHLPGGEARNWGPEEYVAWCRSCRWCCCCCECCCCYCCCYCCCCL
ncbi:unnamed protein product [Polarella glacialis]|uniref:Methyltransferase type 11 domain-containing protein n=1 Tax=Polarella glacialis TaxID=89957 RepID=A0A813E195_POLGL|nr:unnamed protein product [Polarella glacialis]